MNHSQYMIPLTPQLLQETCTGCGKTDSMFEMNHWDKETTLCQPCFKVHQDALKIEEETTQPWNSAIV